MLSWNSNPYRHRGEPIVLPRCCKYYICHQPPAIRRETAGQVREPTAAPAAGQLEMKPERVLKQIGGILTDYGNRVNPWRHSAASKRSRRLEGFHPVTSNCRGWRCRWNCPGAGGAGFPPGKPGPRPSNCRGWRCRWNCPGAGGAGFPPGKPGPRPAGPIIRG